jgi:menaquinone-dependent protoporphyrinogen oxidase
MTPRILVAYATKHGSTREVAERIAATLRTQDLHVDLLPAPEVDEVTGYDAVVVGGSIYFGHWHRDAIDLLRRHRTALAERAVYAFGLGPLKLADEELRKARAQLDRALRKVPELEPAAAAIFGGVIKPPELRFPFNRMSASDTRDWEAIRAWALEVAGGVAGTRTPELVGVGSPAGRG